MATVAALTEDFGGGAVGASITTSNTVFDTISGAGAPATFATGGYMRNAAGGTDLRLHEAAYTAAGTMWFGLYFIIDAVPTSSTGILTVYSADTKICDIRIVAGTSTLQLRSVNTQRWVSTSLAVGVRHRLALQVSPTVGGTGTLRLRLYTGANLNGSTPSQDSGAQTASATVASSNNIRLGFTSADATLVWRAARLRADNASEPAGVTVVNQVPVANAGPDQPAVGPGTTVTLNGTGSSDPDGSVVSYLWTPPAGITLSSNTAASPTFTAPNTAGALTFTLVVTDNSGATSDPDTVSVTVTSSTSGTEISTLAENFTRATAGTAVTTANTIFDTITGAGTASTFSTDSGSPAMRTASGGTDGRIHQADYTATDNVWFGFYFVIETVPTLNTGILSVYSGDIKVCDVRVLAGTSTIQLRSVNTARWESSPVAVGVRHRIAVRVAPTATGAGTLRVRLYEGNLRDSVSTSQDSGVQVASATVGTTDNIRIGALSPDATLAWKMARLRADTAVEPPAITTGNIAPTANAGADKAPLEPYTAFTLQGSGTDPDPGAVIVEHRWRQISGADAPLTGSGLGPRTGVAPAVMFGTDLVYGLIVVDDKGALSAEDEVTIPVMSHTHFARVEGLWHPVLARTK